MADPLVTVEQAKAWLGIELQASDDALIARLIDAAGAFVESACGRPFLARNFSELHDGDGGARLLLRYRPVISVAGLAVDGVAIPPAAAPGQPGWRLVRDGLVLQGFDLGCGIGNVAVDYTAGYETAPADVAEAVCELVALRYRGRQRVGKAAESLGHAGSASYVQADASPFVRAVILRHTRANLL